MWGPSWLSTSPRSSVSLLRSPVNISKLEGLSTAQTQPPAPCLTGQQVSPTADNSPRTRPLRLSGSLGGGCRGRRTDPLPTRSLSKPKVPACAPRAQHGWATSSPPSSSSLPGTHGIKPCWPSASYSVSGAAQGAGGWWGRLEPHHAGTDPGLYVTLRFGTGWRWFRGPLALCVLPAALRAAPSRAPQPNDRGTALPRRRGLRPLRPLPRSTPPRHFTTKSALLAQPGIETSLVPPSSSVPGLRTQGPWQIKDAPDLFVSARQGARRRLAALLREGEARRPHAAPRRAATSEDGAAAPAHPSRRTLVFRVDLPHQRDHFSADQAGLDGVR